MTVKFHPSVDDFVLLISFAHTAFLLFQTIFPKNKTKKKNKQTNQQQQHLKNLFMSKPKLAKMSYTAFLLCGAAS